MHTPEKNFSQAPTTEKTAAMVDWLLEKKARDLLALDLSRLPSVAEATIIVTATSIRHGQGLADYVLERAREAGYEFLRMEGHAVGQWILLDLNDVVVHIFQPDMRALYRLDDLWPTAPVLRDTRSEEGA